MRGSAQGMRKAATLAALIATSALIPTAGFSVRPSPPPPPPEPFDLVALISVGTVQPTPECQTGLQTSGVALDVRSGTFDGIWWNSMCFDSNGSPYGRWAVYYITGRATDAILGTWKAERRSMTLSDTGLTYVGSFGLTAGYGPYSGIHGVGDMTLRLGAQQWMRMSGEFFMPHDSASSMSNS